MLTACYTGWPQGCPHTFGYTVNNKLGFGTLVLFGNPGPSDLLVSVWSSLPLALTAALHLHYHPRHRRTTGGPDFQCPPPHLDTDGVKGAIYFGLYGGSNTSIPPDITDNTSKKLYSLTAKHCTELIN